MKKHHPTITLRSDQGVQTARLLRLGASLASVTVAHAYQEDEILELHLELPGFDAEVQGLVQVRRVSVRPDGSYNTLLRIVRMRRRDQALLEEWHEQANRGDSPSLTSGRALNSAVPSRSAPPERRGPWPASASPSVSRGVHISSVAEKRAGAGRAAIRSVLRAASADPEHPKGADDGAQPTIQLDLARAVPTVQVRYDTESWRRDWRDWLVQALLFVHTPPPHPSLDTTLAVHLSYPPLVDVRCSGRVVTLHASGFGLALDANPQAIAREVPGLEQQSTSPPRSRAITPPDAAQDEAFWTRMFGLGDEPQPLEAVLAAQPHPLESLQGLEASERKQLTQILACTDDDYMTMADRVAALLGTADWHWPELASLAKGAESPLDEAAACIVLATATRQTALALLRTAAGRGGRVQVEPGEDGPCAICRPHVGVVRSPLAQAHHGLPPYHLACRCRLAHVRP